ncbi:DnaA ATPase domain-containing protein [Roseovarius autotrophicus]|uniref:DnaA ATPase domain-containing protein n=1 Tax=Roseovarius autotrophicus TaxID=2824121 RepID=UPI0019FD4F62|nr:DnaA/Hda family protein [Roseovarius autotrophicus]MBE0453513.1 chromosomal replication initiator DnaA [Roseovarius sp.]
MSARQLSFDLPVRTALGREDFFVSPVNAQAVALIEGWRDWPARKLMLAGPGGAGKTHLAHVWAGLSDARIVMAEALVQADIPALAAGPVVVEDAHAIARDRPAEEALFHLHNLVLAEGYSLLITAREAPALWGLGLPDLASRMAGTLMARLGPPDDALLAAVLSKLFADRQISPSPDTVPYLARRIERAFDAAHRVVAELDARALAEGRAITRAFAAEVLDNPAL